jgi:hypothetical protein
MNLKAIPALCVTLCVGQSVQAQFNYTVNADETITITGYNGAGGVVSIPTAINGLPVTSIGDFAFENINKVRSVIIPASVTSIGQGVFESCLGLTNVTIPDSVTSIGIFAFAASSLPSVTIPASITNIGIFAFDECTSLISVYFWANAPSADSTMFAYAPATAYYLPGTIGWAGFSADTGLPAAQWRLPYPVILTCAPSFGVQTNNFGFIISWATNIPVVVEACTSLANPVWTPLSTNTLADGSVYFSEPVQANASGRFYRITSP